VQEQGDRIRVAVKRAVDIAKEYDETLQAVILDRVLSHLLDTIEETPPDNGEPQKQRSIRRLAEMLGVTVDELQMIYHFGEERPEIISYKPSTKSQSTRELAALYIIASDVVYNKSTVPSEEIEEICKKWGVYDKSNFSYNYMGYKRWFVRMDREDGRHYQLTFPGRQDLREIVRRLIDMVD